MRRSPRYHPPRAEHVIETLGLEAVEAFLLMRIEEAGRPYLECPYLVVGRTDYFADPPHGVDAVLNRPRVFLCPPPVGERGGFHLRVEVPRVEGVEEVEEGRWRVDETYEPVDDLPPFRARRIGRARHVRADGLEELQVDLPPTVFAGPPGEDADDPGPPFHTVLHWDGRRIIPARWDWLRLSLADPGKLRTEQYEDERAGLLLAALDS